MAETMTMPIFTGVIDSPEVPTAAARATIFQIGRILDHLLPLEYADVGAPDAPHHRDLDAEQAVFGRRVQCILNCIIDGSVLHVYHAYTSAQHRPAAQAVQLGGRGGGSFLAASDPAQVMAAAAPAVPSSTLRPFGLEELQVGNVKLDISGLQCLRDHHRCPPQQQRLLDMAAGGALVTSTKGAYPPIGADAGGAGPSMGLYQEPPPRPAVAPEPPPSASTDPPLSQEDNIEHYLAEVETFGKLAGAPDLKAVLYFVLTALQRVRLAAQQAQKQAQSSAEEHLFQLQSEAGVVESKSAPSQDEAAPPPSTADGEDASLAGAFPHLFHDGVFLMGEDAVPAALAAYAVLHLVAAQWRIAVCSCDSALGSAQRIHTPFPISNTVPASVMLAGMNGRHPTRQAIALAIGGMLAPQSPGSLHEQRLDLVRFLLPPCSVQHLTLQRPSDYTSVMAVLGLATPPCGQDVSCVPDGGVPAEFAVSERPKRVFLHSMDAEAALVFRTMALQNGLRALHARFVSDMNAWAAVALAPPQTDSDPPLGLWRTPTHGCLPAGSLFAPAALVELASLLLSGAEEARHPALFQNSDAVPVAQGGRGPQPLDPLQCHVLPVALLGERSGESQWGALRPGAETEHGGGGELEQKNADVADEAAGAQLPALQANDGAAAAAAAAATGRSESDQATLAAARQALDAAAAAPVSGLVTLGRGGRPIEVPAAAAQELVLPSAVPGDNVQQEHDLPAEAQPTSPSVTVTAAAAAQAQAVTFKGQAIHTAPPFTVAATSCLVMAYEMSPFSAREDILEAVVRAVDAPPVDSEFHYDTDEAYGIFEMPTHACAVRLVERLHGSDEFGGRRLQLKLVASQNAVDEHAEQDTGASQTDASRPAVTYVPAEGARRSVHAAQVPSHWARELGSSISAASLETLVWHCCSTFSVFNGDVFAHVFALASAEQLMQVVGAVLTSHSLPQGDVTVRLVVTALLSLAHAGQLTLPRAQALLLWCRGALQDTLLLQSTPSHLKRVYLQVPFADMVCGWRTPPPTRRDGGGPYPLHCTVLTPRELRTLSRELRTGDLVHAYLKPQACHLLTGLMASLAEGGVIPPSIAPLQPTVHAHASVSLAHGPQPLVWRHSVPSEHALSAAAHVPCTAAIVCSEWDSPLGTDDNDQWVVKIVKQCTEQARTAVPVRTMGFKTTDKLLLLWAKWLLAEMGALPPVVQPLFIQAPQGGGLQWQPAPPKSLHANDPASWLGSIVNVPAALTGLSGGQRPCIGVLTSVEHTGGGSAAPSQGGGAAGGAAASEEASTCSDDKGEHMGTDYNESGSVGVGETTPAAAAEGMTATVALLSTAGQLDSSIPVTKTVQYPLTQLLKELDPVAVASYVFGGGSGRNKQLPVDPSSSAVGVKCDMQVLLPLVAAMPLSWRLVMLQRGALTHVQLTALSGVGAVSTELFHGKEATPQEGAVARTALFLHTGVDLSVEDYVQAFMQHSMAGVLKATLPSPNAGNRAVAGGQGGDDAT